MPNIEPTEGVSQKPQPSHAPSPGESLLSRPFVMISLVNFCIFMSWQMTAVGMPVYLASLGGDEIAVGLVTTIATIAAIIFRPIVGMLVDHFGRRGFVVGGLLLMTCATFAYAIFPVVGVILTIRVLHGAGWGFGQTAVNTVAADVIPRRRFAEGMGYFAMVNSLAIAFAPALSIQLISGGNSQLMIGCATAFALLAAIVAVAFFVTGYQEPPLKTERLTSSSFNMTTLFEKSAFRPGIFMFFCTFAFGAITTFISLLGASRGLSNMSSYFLVYAITCIITRPPIGKLIDRKGFWLPGILACIAYSFSLMLIAFADSYLMFGVAGVFVGLGLGTAMGVFQTMAVSKAHPSRRGVATSTYMVLFDLGIGVGSFVAGIIASQLGYGNTFLVMAAAPMVTLVLFLVSGKKTIDSYHVGSQGNR